jgi:hypothetical protein
MFVSIVALMALGLIQDTGRGSPPPGLCYEMHHPKSKCVCTHGLRYRCEVNSRGCSLKFDCECTDRECEPHRPLGF